MQSEKCVQVEKRKEVADGELKKKAQRCRVSSSGVVVAKVEEASLRSAKELMAKIHRSYGRQPGRQPKLIRVAARSDLESFTLLSGSAWIQQKIMSVSIMPA